MTALRSLSAALAAFLFSAGVAVAAPATVGAVDKVQAQADATFAGQPGPWPPTPTSISGIAVEQATAGAWRRR